MAHQLGLVLGLIDLSTVGETARSRAFSDIYVLFFEEVGGRVPTGFGCLFPVGLDGWSFIGQPYGSGLVLWGSD
jgi:hypothetical protein